MKAPDRQKREEADWGTLKERDKGGKTSPLEAKEDNRRATRQAPPRPFAMSNTSIRIFISMKYERFKKIVVFIITSLNSAPIVFFLKSSWLKTLFAIYILYPKYFFMECVDLLIDQQAQPLQNVFSSGCPPHHRHWWEMMKTPAQESLPLHLLHDKPPPSLPSTSTSSRSLCKKKTKLEMYVMEKVLCISVILTTISMSIYFEKRIVSIV